MTTAAPVIQSLIDEYPANFNLLWDYARILAEQGEFSTAAEYFNKVRLQHPFIVNNQDYLLEYSQTLIKLKQIPKAEKYLQYAREITSEPQQIDQILTTLKNRPEN